VVGMHRACYSVNSLNRNGLPERLLDARSDFQGLPKRDRGEHLYVVNLDVW
jgi:hypothetical protein